LRFPTHERKFDDVGVIQWRIKRSIRTGYVVGEHVAAVMLTGGGWLALYWGDLPGVRSREASSDSRARIGCFPSVDEAVAAVEERHAGRDACE
jgi:hypothetical protein